MNHNLVVLVVVLISFFASRCHGGRSNGLRYGSRPLLPPGRTKISTSNSNSFNRGRIATPLRATIYQPSRPAGILTVAQPQSPLLPAKHLGAYEMRRPPPMFPVQTGPKVPSRYVGDGARFQPGLYQLVNQQQQQRQRLPVKLVLPSPRPSLPQQPDYQGLQKHMQQQVSLVNQIAAAANPYRNRLIAAMANGDESAEDYEADNQRRIEKLIKQQIGRTTTATPIDDYDDDDEPPPRGDDSTSVELLNVGGLGRGVRLARCGKRTFATREDEIPYIACCGDRAFNNRQLYCERGRIIRRQKFHRFEQSRGYEQGEAKTTTSTSTTTTTTSTMPTTVTTTTLPTTTTTTTTTTTQKPTTTAQQPGVMIPMVVGNPTFYPAPGFHLQLQPNYQLQTAETNWGPQIGDYDEAETAGQDYHAGMTDQETNGFNQYSFPQQQGEGSETSNQEGEQPVYQQKVSGAPPQEQENQHPVIESPETPSLNNEQIEELQRRYHQFLLVERQQQKQQPPQSEASRHSHQQQEVYVEPIEDVQSQSGGNEKPVMELVERPLPEKRKQPLIQSPMAPANGIYTLRCEDQIWQTREEPSFYGCCGNILGDIREMSCPGTVEAPILISYVENNSNSHIQHNVQTLADEDN